jgi:hypothetical protein
MVIEEGSVVTTYGGRDVLFSDLGSSFEETTYALKDPLRPEHVRVGKPWTGPVPSLVDPHEVAMGHLLNDGAKIVINDYPGEQRLQEIIREYELASAAAANVRWSTEKSWDVVATRHIIAGEELLVSYGALYWLSPIMYQSPNPMIRLLIYLLVSKVSPDACLMGAITSDEQGNAVLVSTGEEVSEEWSRDFIQNVMGLTDDDRKRLEAAREEEGEMTWRDMLYQFIDRMLDMEEGGGEAAVTATA